MDMVAEKVDAKRLDTPLDFTPPSDKRVEDELVEKILEAVYAAKTPMILVDVLTARFHCTPHVRKLVDMTNFPVPPFPFPHTSQLMSVLHDKPGKRDPERNTSNLRGCV
jgi:pyruvate decarboxylase